MIYIIILKLLILFKMIYVLLMGFWSYSTRLIIFIKYFIVSKIQKAKKKNN